jgi:hypothetical protein
MRFGFGSAAREENKGPAEHRSRCEQIDYCFGHDPEDILAPAPAPWGVQGRSGRSISWP